MATIVIHSIGTLGDLNPFRLVAKALVARGHQVKFATLSAHKKLLELDGIRHFSVRPDLLVKDPHEVRKAMDHWRGIEYLFEQVVFPIRQTYEDLETACDGADLVIGGTLAFTPSLIHEKKGIPWISVALQSTIFLSDYQFPVLPHATWLRLPPFNHRYLSRGLKKVFRYQIHQRSKEWYRLRKDLGLTQRPNIMLDAPLSPILQLAAYSPLFSGRQPDWPSHRSHCGFIQTGPDDEKLSPATQAFLNEGEPPVVFTLGSAAVLLGESFFETCLEVAKKSSFRSILICGSFASVLKTKAKDFPHIWVVQEEPYSALFKNAKVVVHQGGVGTTGEALRAGSPMVVVPFGQDQYDNACHVARMGCGLWCPASSLTEERLEQLLTCAMNKRIKESSQAIAQQIRRENGLDQMIKHVEKTLSQGNSS